MKKVPFFPHFKVRAWSQKSPPFSVFLGTSMRATFHIKFSDRGLFTGQNVGNQVMLFRHGQLALDIRPRC